MSTCRERVCGGTDAKNFQHHCPQHVKQVDQAHQILNSYPNSKQILIFDPFILSQNPHFLHTLNRRQPQQLHAIIQHHPRTLIQRHPRPAKLLLLTHHPQHIIARAQQMRHLEQISDHSRGLQRLKRVLQDIWVLRQTTDQIRCVRLRQHA